MPFFVIIIFIPKSTELGLKACMWLQDFLPIIVKMADRHMAAGLNHGPLTQPLGSTMYSVKLQVQLCIDSVMT